MGFGSRAPSTEWGFRNLVRSLRDGDAGALTVSPLAAMWLPANRTGAPRPTSECKLGRSVVFGFYPPACSLPFRIGTATPSGEIG